MTLSAEPVSPEAAPMPARPPGDGVVRLATRLTGIDATRGIALLGMMAVHSLYVVDDAGAPTVPYLLFGGRAAAMFAVLAGVGIALMTGRGRVGAAQAWPTAAALLARAVVIAAFGLFLGYTDTDMAVVILAYYGVLFLLAIPLVFLPTWVLAVGAVAAAVGLPVLSQIWRAGLPTGATGNPDLVGLLTDPLGVGLQLGLTGVYPALPWLTYVCAGLVVGRLNLRSIAVSVWLLVTGVVLAVASAVTSTLLLDAGGGLAALRAAQPTSGLNPTQFAELLDFGASGHTPTNTWWWLAVDGPHTNTPLNLVGATGSALAVLGAMLLLARWAGRGGRRVFSVVLTPLAAAGSMTLTFYVLHVMFINSPLDVFDSVTGYVVQVVAVLLVGMGWRLSAGRGPCEGLAYAAANAARRWAGGTTAAPRAGS